MSCLPKPVLRGHLIRKGVINIISALTVASLVSTTYYLTVAAPRKKAYAEFHRTYDAEAHYKDMVKWGYMTDLKKLDL